MSDRRYRGSWTVRILPAVLAAILIVALAAPIGAAELQCRCSPDEQGEQACQCGPQCRCQRSRTGDPGRPAQPGNGNGPSTPGAARSGDVLTNEVDRVASVMDLETGKVLAEIGAGNGRFSVRLAEVVGPEGHVYANDISSRALQNIERMVERAGLDNVTVVEGDLDDANLPEGQVDVLMMRMVYHMMTDPEPMNRSFFRALKPGGTMLIIDGYPKNGRNAPGVPANRSGMGIDPDITVDEVTAAGFELVELIDRWPNVGYALLFRKPAQ